MKNGKILASVLALVMMYGVGAPVVENLGLNYVMSASAAETDYTRTLNDDGTVTITKYTGSEADVVIPDTLGGRKVTAIGGSAFTKNTALKSVVLPKYLEKINSSVFDGAFKNCTNLEKITFNSNLKVLGSDVFFGCKKLKNVTIPNSVTTLGDSCFRDCTSLTDVTIPDSVTDLGYSYTFSGCTGLEMVEIGNNVTKVTEGTFYGCTNLKSITMSNNVSSIGSYAFTNCTSLKEINFPSNLTSIGSYSFKDCDSLEKISIPSSVTKIGVEAFRGCDNLSSVELKEGLKTVEYQAFLNCPKLKHITIPKSVKNIGYLFSGAFGYNGKNKVDDFKIYCYRDTAGEEYAMKYGFDYEFLDDSPKKGDINGDGIINLSDLTAVTAHAKGIEKLTDLSAADVNGDGAVNLVDVSMIAAHVKNIKKLP